jgi:uncharacterized protein
MRYPQPHAPMSAHGAADDTPAEAAGREPGGRATGAQQEWFAPAAGTKTLARQWRGSVAGGINGDALHTNPARKGCDAWPWAPQAALRSPAPGAVPARCYTLCHPLPLATGCSGGCAIAKPEACVFDWWWAYLALGALVGFFSGLLGIGGGAAMVPVLAFIYAAKAFTPDHVVHLALGTAIASILFTSVASVRSHHLRGAVNWSILRSLVPGVLLGTLTGALLSRFLDARLLSIVFTAFIYYLSARMFASARPQPTGELPGVGVMSAAGAAIGFVSSLTATGGAALVVSFLVKRNVPILQAIGTAAAVGWPLALAGTAGYVIAGFGITGRPQYSVGFVYLPALAMIASASVAMAPVGAALAHSISGGALRKIFAGMLFVLATSMALRFF